LPEEANVNSRSVAGWFVAGLCVTVATAAWAQARSDDNAITPYSGGRFMLRQAQSGECVVALQGTVTHDAASRFDDVVSKADRIRCNKPLILLLESPGGLVLDAIDLAERVRARGLRTVARYRCASACSLVFLGGVERVLWGSRAAIGLHQAKDYDCDRFGTSLGTHRIRDYLRDVVPATADRIFEIITGTSCQSITWIFGDRAIELGVATKLEAPGVDVFGPEASRRVAQ
jgi:hypothetical protein